jgi:hypothetical protein
MMTGYPSKHVGPRNENFRTLGFIFWIFNELNSDNAGIGSYITHE